MGFENLYGVGKGSAQVLDSSGILGAYQKQLYNAEKKRQAQDEELSKYVGDFETDKVQSKDLPFITEKYNEVQGLFNKYQNVTDKSERLKLLGEIQSKKKEVNNMVMQSQNEKEELKPYLALRISNRADDLRDGFNDELNETVKVSTFDPKYGELKSKLLQTNPLRDQFDANKIVEQIEKDSIRDPSDQTIVWRNGEQKFQNVEGKILDKDAMLKNLEYQLKGKDGDRLAKYIYANYGNKDGKPDEADILAFRDEMYNRLGQKYKVVTKDGGFVNRPPKDPKENNSESINVMIGGGAVIPYDRPENGAPQPVVEPKSIVRFSPSRVNLAGTKGYDMSKGQEVSIPNMADGVSISAIGDFPFIKSSATFKNANDNKLRGTVAQPNFVKKYGDKGVEYRRGAIVSFKDNSGRSRDLIVPVESLPRNKSINKAIAELEKQTGKPSKGGGKAIPKIDY